MKLKNLITILLMAILALSPISSADIVAQDIYSVSETSSGTVTTSDTNAVAAPLSGDGSSLTQTTYTQAVADNTDQTATNTGSIGESGVTTASDSIAIQAITTNALARADGGLATQYATNTGEVVGDNVQQQQNLVMGATSVGSTSQQGFNFGYGEGAGAQVAQSAHVAATAGTTATQTVYNLGLGTGVTTGAIINGEGALASQYLWATAVGPDTTAQTLMNSGEVFGTDSELGQEIHVNAESDNIQKPVVTNVAYMNTVGGTADPKVLHQIIVSGATGGVVTESLNNNANWEEPGTVELSQKIQKIVVATGDVTSTAANSLIRF